MADGYDLEALLQQQDQRSIVPIQEPSFGVMQKADKSATLYDLMKMINRLVTLTMKDLAVEFIPDEGRDNILLPEEPLDHPYITYKVISRTPKDELKPRVRESFLEKGVSADEERFGEIYGQKLKCYVQFNIFASVYGIAEQVMERFEELIFTYSGYFKKNGIAEIYFTNQLTDTDYNLFRQTISVRNLQYYVEVEKLHVIFREKIKEIETYLSLEKEA